MTWTRYRLLVPLAAVALTAGCSSLRLQRASETYYFEGAEAALAQLESVALDPADHGLLDLERAMALVELGRYQAALELLDRAAARLDGTPDPWAVRTAEGFYLGEHHERVMTRTLAVAAALALQDLEGAADRAARVVDEIEAGGCADCDLDFPRAVAALALEGAGRRAAAAAAVAPGVDRTSFLAEQLERLHHGPDPGDGFVPPPVAGPRGERALVVILLLGAAPEKATQDLFRGPSWVFWPAYRAVWPTAAENAVLRCDDGTSFSGELLLDLAELAPASLTARREHEEALAAAAGARQSSDYDLRCWSTLPAVGRLIRAPLSPAAAACELVAVSWSGEEVSREPIELPGEWLDGPLFVLRRIP